MRKIYSFLLLLLTSAIYAQPEGLALSTLRSNSQLPSIPIKNPEELIKRNIPYLVIPSKDTARAKIRIRCGLSRPVGSPLILVDGTIMEYSFLSTIDVNSICDITVLNEMASSAIFGPQGAAGAIVIITGKKNPDMIRVMDRLDRSMLPGATVTFISSDRRDTLMYVADSAGQVNRKDLKKDVSYIICVTATGYKAFTGSVSDLKNGEVRLERDFILGPEVIVSSGHVCICRRLYVCQQQQDSQECGVQVKLINEQAMAVSNKRGDNRVFNVYPNPVQRGQLITLKMLQGYFASGTVRVLTLDGKQLFSMAVNGTQQQGMIQLTTQPGWASGVYILQLDYANGRVGASEKVILQ